MLAFHYRSATSMIYCTNAASTSAVKQCGIGGADLARCLPLKSAADWTLAE